MPAQLTIRLTGGRQDHVSVAALIRALENAVKTLRSLEEELARSSGIRWEIIRASSRSPLSITVAAHPNGVATQRVASKIATAYVRGIAQMEKAAILPEHFTEEAALAVQETVNAAEDDGKKLTVSASKKKTVSPTPQIVTHIKEIVAKSRKYADYGTIEGTLQEISIRGGSKIGISESFTGQWIMCAVAPEQIQEAMRYFGKRVAVSGTIRHSNHRPTSITIEEPIQVLRDSSELPQVEAMPPIDITGGLSSEEYVRRLRNAK
jgi:hypothetical protein